MALMKLPEASPISLLSPFFCARFDGDSLRGAGPVEHRHRIDEVLLEQRVLDRARDTVVLAAGTGADHEFDISFRFPGLLRV